LANLNYEAERTMSQKIIEPGSIPRTSIELRTRKNTPIFNSQEHDLTPFYLHLVESYKKRFEGRVVFLSVPSPIYNCHGFTFASRRTAICEHEEIMKIISEDDYRMVENEDDVQIGDIITYWDKEKGDVEHSGLVVGKEGKYPLVLSKWGRGKEVLHLYCVCPYDATMVRYYRVSR
jgi:hypothetical protein